MLKKSLGVKYHNCIGSFLYFLLIGSLYIYIHKTLPSGFLLCAPLLYNTYLSSFCLSFFAEKVSAHASVHEREGKVCFTHFSEMQSVL